MDDGYSAAADYKAIDYSKLKQELLATGFIAVRFPLRLAGPLERLLADAYRLRSNHARARGFVDGLKVCVFVGKLISRFIWAAVFHRGLTDIILMYHVTLPSYRIMKSSRDVVLEFRKGS